MKWTGWLAIGLTGCSPLVARAGDVARAPFRVFYSNDATNIVRASAFARTEKASLVDRLRRSIDEAGEADAQLLQPGNGWVPWWRSALYPADAHYRWFVEKTGLPLDPFGEYMLRGGDLVAEFVAQCRRRNVAAFVSLRMNDYHGAETQDFVVDALHDELPPKDAGLDVGLAAAQSRFQLEHPEYRLRPDPPDYRAATTEERLRYIAEPALRIRLRTARVFNWEIPEVRAQKLGFLRELCENHDLDGIELDFMRWSALFRLDETTVEQRVAIMVDFIGATRAMLDRPTGPGKKRWLCVRIPLRLSGHAPLGIDLPRWVAAGVDLINLSCHYITEQQTDLAEIHRLVPRTPLYLELTFANANAPVDRTVKREADSRYRLTTDEQFYTAAHLAYARGAGGVSLFNFVYSRSFGLPNSEPPFHVLPRLKDREWLARQPQHYFLSHSGNPPSAPSQFARHSKLVAGRPSLFLLDTAPPTGGWKSNGRLRLQTKERLTGRNVVVLCNNARLPETPDVSEPYPTPYLRAASDAQTLKAWAVTKALLKDGVNKFSVSVDAGSPLEVVFVDLAIR